ncbi:MAG: hypothetical protein L3J41_10925 [Melioribacteraceae bacterium]|nr:hypothetical protein [Melioribacteraceae bacterium]
MKNELYKIDKQLKRFLSTFLIVLTIGVTVGLFYLYSTTSMTTEGTVERYNGSTIEADEFEIAESYPKPITEMLLTTHSHIISFAFIFGLIGIIFYFNSVVVGFWKNFLLIEPLVSTVITFFSIWGIRYFHEWFVYVTIISSSLMYISFYVVSAISLYELNFKSNGKE